MVMPLHGWVILWYYHEYINSTHIFHMLQRTDIYPVIIENVEHLVQQLQLQAFMSSIQAAVQAAMKSCTSWTNPTTKQES